MSTARTMTPAGDLTAVGPEAPSVQQTGASSGWTRPSETPTQIGEAGSGVRSISDQVASGLMTGQTLGDRYRIVRKIGAGGMGEVWEAQHIVIKKSVAVKVLTLDPTVTNGAEQAERLMREARLVAAVRHDNVVDITDFGHTPMGAPYFVMELLRGKTLKGLVTEQGPMAWGRARDVLVQLTDALGAAHAAGIIHRDIKPDNVFLIERGGKEVVKIIDFGIAKTTLLGDEGMTLTQTGMVCGTPAFMSPEQARGERIDERTDIYSVGCLAYQLLTGRQPFVANTPAEALYQQLFVEPTPMRDVAPARDIPPNLDAIVLTAMRKNRELRFQSMGDLQSALENLERASAAITVPREEIPTPPKEVQTRFASMAQMTFSDNRPDYLGGAAPSSRGSAGLVVGIIGGALLLGAAAGGAYFFFVQKNGTFPGSEFEATDAAEAEAAAAAAAEAVGAEGEANAGAILAGDTTGGVVEAAAPVPSPEGGTDSEPNTELAEAPAGAGSKSRPNSKPAAGPDPDPVAIEPPPVYYDEDHVAEGQGPDEPLPPPPLPDAEPDPEPEPEPEPEPVKEKKKPPKPPPEENKTQKVDDLRDPWD